MKPYPEYKSTDLDWLPRVPAHWEVKRADGVLTYEKKQISEVAINNESVWHYSIPAVQKFGTALVEEGNTIDSGKLLIENPALLVSKLNPRKGCVIIARPDKAPKNLRTVASTEFVVLRARECDLNWAYLLFKSEPVRVWLSALVKSATNSHQRANPADIYKLWIAIPPLDEQAQIVRYLGAKHREIESYIAAKRSLLARLKELSAATISRAVTRGLNPDVAVKSSGVEWLGDVPEHWEVKRLKHIGELGGGAGFPNDLQGKNGNIPFYKVGDMNNFDKEMGEANNYVSEELARQLNAKVFPVNSIIFPKVGAALLTNKRRLLSVPACVDNNVMVYVTEEKYLPFVFYCLRVFDFIYLVNPGAVPSVNEKQVANLKIPLPPLSEQTAIVAYLENQLAIIGEARGRIEREIELAGELYQTLVANVVTGQFDVSAIEVDDFEVADDSSHGDVAAVVEDELEIDESLEAGDDE